MKTRKPSYRTRKSHSLIRPSSLVPLLAFLSLALLVSCKDASKPAANQETPQPAAPKTDAQAPAKSSAPAALAAPAGGAAPAEEKISFSSQVRPILSNNCFACHGPDSHNQTSPFRLDTEEHSRANLAKAGEPPRYGVVPGKPEESLLLKRIVTHDRA